MHLRRCAFACVETPPRLLGVFNLSGSELIFLVLIALVVLGPDKLPEAMRKAGKAYNDFKKMTSGFQDEMRTVLEEPMREFRETANLVKDAAMFDPSQAVPVQPSSPADSFPPKPPNVETPTAQQESDAGLADDVATGEAPSA